MTDINSRRAFLRAAIAAGAAWAAADLVQVEEALAWAAKIAVACRCAQEVRVILPEPPGMDRDVARGAAGWST